RSKSAMAANFELGGVCVGVTSALPTSGRTGCPLAWEMLSDEARAATVQPERQSVNLFGEPRALELPDGRTNVKGSILALVLVSSAAVCQEPWRNPPAQAVPNAEQEWVRALADPAVGGALSEQHAQSHYFRKQAL